MYIFVFGYAVSFSGQINVLCLMSIGVILALSFYLYVKLYFVANKTKYNIVKSFV